MIKRAMTIAFMLTLVLGLAGCQFAMDEVSGKNEDLFVGVSLRIEDWGKPTRFDEEGTPYWESEGEEEIVELTPEQAAAFARGEIPVDLFSHEVPISKYAYYQVKREDDAGSYAEAVNTWPGSAQAHISVTDEGEEYSVNLKVYVCGEAVARYDIMDGYVSMTLDNVYQRPDGSVYCAREDGGISGYIGGWTQTIRQEETTKDIHGNVQSYAMEISVEFIQVPELQEATVLAFDAEHNLLGAMPVALDGADDFVITPPDGTAYLILEETAVDAEGNTILTRSFADMPKTKYERSLALFTVYVPSEDHLARPNSIRLPEPT